MSPSRADPVLGLNILLHWLAWVNILPKNPYLAERFFFEKSYFAGEQKG